ncbi:transpeptidase family protein [Bacteroidales bacterium OttesenSCG-928-C19]|nr:transpeptidase family protein [Bacteroidales bacterium OttesenSCG-928-C19]
MQEKRKLLTKRLIIIYLSLLLLWAVPIVASIIKIQFVEGSFWRGKAIERTVAMREVKANRGKIYSADGRTLATSVPIFDISLDLGKERIINPKTYDTTYAYVIHDSIFKPQLKNLCEKLGYMFPQSGYNYFLNELTEARRKGNRYFTLKRNVSLNDKEKMKTFPIMGIEKKSKKRIDENGDTIPVKKQYSFHRGVIVQRKDRRENPYTPIARRTIGTLNTSDGCDTCYNGLDGYYNTILKGKKGKRMERRLASKVWVPVEDEDFVSAEDGKDIVSTIDVSLQELAEKSLRNCLETNNADGGYVILMEVQTGYVRAISSLYRTGDSLNIKYIETANGACTDLYEPGSTYKTVTMMALLENGICDTSLIVPTGVKRFGRTSIHDVNDKDIGNVSLKRAFEVSSNVGICQAVWDGYNEHREDFKGDIQKILPYKKLGVDLVIKEPTPTMLDDMKPDRNFLNIAYGYASNITALQMLTFYNAIANNGKMVKPLFCSDILESGKVVKNHQPIVIKEKICSDKTLHKVQDLLVSVVENGSARRLSKTPYGIAGKTGTSQVGYETKGKKVTYCASFAGYFPANDPRYSCIVVVNNPRKNRTHGGELAAPVFKDLSDRVCGTKIDIEFTAQNAKHGAPPSLAAGSSDEIISTMNQLGIPYTVEGISPIWLKENTIENDTLVLAKYTPSPNYVPNVRGMTVKDAIKLLEGLGMDVSFEGKGKVREQSVASGSTYRKGSKIHLVLR